jgi:putative transposase
MCLQFAFVLLTRVTAWLRLSQREEAWKTAEIVVLRRPRLTWAGRALLAALLSVIPKAERQGPRLLVTPDTVLRWHRDIACRRRAASARRGRSGRPATRRNIKALVVRQAKENPGWGYRRIHGELAGPGASVAAPAVWEILNANGTGPAPRRTGPAWSQFPHSQAGAILACDFFSADLPDGTRACVLTVTGHATRRIRIPGVTLYPTGERAAQQARNLITGLGEQAERMKFMIRGRGPDFTPASGAVLAGAGIAGPCCATYGHPA